MRERDPYGFKRYTLMFSALSAGSSTLQFRARFRKDGRSGLVPASRTTALGIAIPFHQYSFELEGVDDRDIGRSLLGTVRWTDSKEQFQWGVTVPLLAPRELSGAVILQFVYRFDSTVGNNHLAAASPAALGYSPFDSTTY